MNSQQSNNEPGKNPQSPKLLSGFSAVLSVAAVVVNAIAIYLIAPQGQTGFLSWLQFDEPDWRPVR